MPVDSRIEELIDLLGERFAKWVETRLNDYDSTLHQRLHPIGQAAYHLGRTEDSIRPLIASGRLPVVRTDKRVLLDLQDIDDWILDHKQQCLGFPGSASREKQFFRIGRSYREDIVI